MPLEIDSEGKQVSVPWLGVTSQAGFPGLFGAWLAGPPELVVENVDDISKKFNSQSKIDSMYNGRLPACKFGVLPGKLECCSVSWTTRAILN